MKKIILVTTAMLTMSSALFAAPMMNNENTQEDKQEMMMKHKYPHHPPVPGCLYESKAYSEGAIISDDGLTQKCSIKENDQKQNNETKDGMPKPPIFVWTQVQSNNQSQSYDD